MKKASTLVCLVMAVALPLAGCGGGGKKNHPQTNPHPLSLAQACPPGKSQMGCAQKTFKTLPKLVLTSPPPGLKFPDVSVWQGAVNWASVAGWQRSNGWHPAAVFKMGEYNTDTQAARNASETARLGFWRTGYWFVRNTGCAHEASQIISAAHAYHLTLVIEDTEVQEARGYAACLTPRLERAGLKVGEYTSPGSNPDSTNPGVQLLWPASYGPSHPPCLFTCKVGVAGQQSIMAWQFTDGQFGPVVNIPGIGHDDVSVDYGLMRMSAPPLPPKPPAPPARVHCYGSHAQKNSSTCKAVYKKVASERSAAKASQAAYDKRGCPVIGQRVRYFSGQLAKNPKSSKVTHWKGALAASKRVYTKNACAVFLQRVNYFNHQIQLNTF